MVNVALLIIIVILTRALHLQGFINSCDGNIAVKSPEGKPQVMSSTRRVGAFGVAGVILLILLKYASLNAFVSSLALPFMEFFKYPALLLMPVLGRWAMVYSIVSFSYAHKEDGVKWGFKQYARWPGFLIATLITIVLVIIVTLVVVFMIGASQSRLLLLLWIIPAAITWLIVATVSLFLKRRSGGLTEDNYIAIGGLAEVSFLVFIIIYFNIILLFS